MRSSTSSSPIRFCWIFYALLAACLLLPRLDALAQPVGRLDVGEPQLSTPLLVTGTEGVLAVELINSGTRELRGFTVEAVPPFGLRLEPLQPAPAVLPVGERAEVSWRVSAEQPDLFPVLVRVQAEGVEPVEREVQVAAVPPGPAPDLRTVEHPVVAPDAAGNFIFRNRHLVALLVKTGNRFGPMILWPTRRPTDPEALPLAVAPALARLAWKEGDQLHSASFLPSDVKRLGDDRLRLRGTAAQGNVTWDLEMELEIGEEPWLKWSASTRPSASASLVRFAPLSLKVAAEPRSEVLFPGVLYDEVERIDAEELRPRLLAPNPLQVTVPLMAVTSGRTTLSLMWDQAQKWGGTGAPAALLGTAPVRDAGAEYRMELFLPSIPDYVREDETTATQTYEVPAGVPVRLQARIAVLREEEDPTAAVRTWADAYLHMGVRKYPVPFERVRELARVSYLRTLWDPQVPGWLPAVGPEPVRAEPSPSNVLALLIDAGLTEKDAVSAELRQRAEVVLDALQAQGPLDPVLAYRVGGVIPTLDAVYEAVRPLIREQLASGAWPLDVPVDDEPARSEEIGPIARRAVTVLRSAVLTGDSDAAGAGRRALEYMAGRFRVPRGGLPGEVPLQAADLLAAADAAEAFLLGYQVSGERRYVDEARYWADTGLPFVYLWGDPARPALKQAALPYMGSDEAMQWIGLRYALVLRALHDVRPDALHDYVSEGILSSAMHQMEKAGANAGLYPERWDVRTSAPEGAWLNPEGVLALMYRLQRYNPQVSHLRLRTGADRMFVASGATILEGITTAQRLRLKLRWIRGEDTFTTITGVPERPIRIEINESPLRRFGLPISREFLPEVTEESQVGWYYDELRQLLILRLRHTSREDNIEVRWHDPRERTEVERIDTRVRPRR
ncbi:MAG: hypothetical protein ACK47B_15755 [Armatimonadota bacterium]